jgi:ankyrin repeat protein
LSGYILIPSDLTTYNTVKFLFNFKQIIDKIVILKIIGFNMTIKLITSETYIDNIRNFLPEKLNSKTPASEKSKKVFDKIINSPHFIFDKSDKKIFDYITTLLIIRPGRTLFKRLLKADKPLKIVLDAKHDSYYEPSESTVILNDSKGFYVSVNSNGEKFLTPEDPSICLAHELVHALHYFEEGPEFVKQKMLGNIIDPDFDDLEEQETIVGKEREAVLCENVFLFHFGYPLRVNHRGCDTITASDCASLGALTNLKELLISDPFLINQIQLTSKRKYTPLNAAILENQMEIVNYLFQVGVDVNAQDGCGTALHAAVETNKPDLVKALLEKDAYPEIRTRKGNALQLALHTRNDEIIEILAPVTNLNKKNAPLLHNVIDDASPEGIKALIRHGADINHKDLDGNTPLMICCDFPEPNSETKQKFAILLEQENLDLNAKNKFGESALYLAVKNGFLWQVDALVKKGAEIPLHLKERVEKYLEWYKKGVDEDYHGNLWANYQES